jgi:hypothetical protein
MLTLLLIELSSTINTCAVVDMVPAESSAVGGSSASEIVVSFIIWVTVDSVACEPASTGGRDDRSRPIEGLRGTDSLSEVSCRMFSSGSSKRSRHWFKM